MAYVYTKAFDKKIEALHSLEVILSSSSTFIQDFETITDSLKFNLRSPNAQLAHSVIALLPTYIPLISDASHIDNLKQFKLALNAFLSPPNGIIEKLADQKERIRDAARAALMSLSLGALKYGSQSQSKLKSSNNKDINDTPWLILEKSIREQGLNGKVWRIREQTLLHLATLHPQHSFPLRSFLSQFISLLEDSDSSVREAARSTIITLFRTSPPQAKTSLKKEITERGIKKNVADEILDGVLRSSVIARPELIPMPIHDPSEEVKLADNNIHSNLSHNNQPNLNPKPSQQSLTTPVNTEVEKLDAVYIASPKDLEREFQDMHQLFSGRETEQNWIPRESQIKRLRGLLRGEAHLQFPDIFYQGLKSIIDGLISISNSLRTTLAINTINLFVDLSHFLKSSLDSLAEIIISCLMRMATLTKKIIVQSSQTAIPKILINVSYSPKLINIFWNSLQEKAHAPRQYAISHLRVIIDYHAQYNKHLIENSNGLQTLENCIKRSLGDANPTVREQSRITYWSFERIWQKESQKIIDSLDSTARKQLEKAKVSAAPVKKSSVTSSSAVAARAQQFKEAKAAFIARNKTGPIPESTIPLPDTPEKKNNNNNSISQTPQKDLQQLEVPQMDLGQHQSPPSPQSPQSLQSVVHEQNSPHPEIHQPESDNLNGKFQSPNNIRDDNGDIEMTPGSPTPVKSMSNRMSTSPRESSPLRNSLKQSTSSLSTSRPDNNSARSSSYGSPPHRPSPLGPGPTSRRAPSERLSVAMMGSQSTPFGSLMAESQPDWNNNSAMEDTFLINNQKSFNETLSVNEDEDEVMNFDGSPLTLRKSSTSSNNYNKRSLSSSASSRRALEIEFERKHRAEVEDALRAEAAQVESSANHLLEIGQAEEDLAHAHISTDDNNDDNEGEEEKTPIKPTKTVDVLIDEDKQKQQSLRIINQTPPSKMRKILAQAEQTVDSPINKFGTPNVLNNLQKNGGKSKWWLNRVDNFENENNKSLNGVKESEHLNVIESLSEKVTKGEILNMNEIEQLNSISILYPINDDKENDDSNIWNKASIFSNIMEGLLNIINDDNVSISSIRL